MIASAGRVFALDLPDAPRPARGPGEGGTAVEVRVGIFRIDFATVILREGSFILAGYLETSWVDPLLARKPGDKERGTRRFRPGEIWAPELDFVDAVDPVGPERKGSLSVSDDGEVKQRVRFRNEFPSAIDLRRFPFDRRKLTIVVAPLDPSAREILLAVDNSHVGQIEEAPSSGWSIEGVAATIVGPNTGGKWFATDGKFVFQVSLTRLWSYYFWRALVPLTLLVAASWLVYWLEVKNLQPQMTLAVGILLTLTAFQHAIHSFLPKGDDLTFLDRHAIASFVLVLASILWVTLIHVALRTRGEQAAISLQKKARFLFPMAYLVMILMSAATMLL